MSIAKKLERITHITHYVLHYALSRRQNMQFAFKMYLSCNQNLSCIPPCCVETAVMVFDSIQ